MELTEEMINKLNDAFWRSTNTDYGSGFVDALEALGFSDEQIEQITKW